LLQVLGPRPQWRRLRQQPGFVACLIAAIVVTLTLTVAQSCIWLSLWEVKTSSDGYLKAQILGGMLAGSGVLWSWVTMRLCGVCRPRPTWTDRLGRMTGVVWIAVGAISAGYLLFAMG
jgi:hypothetical protein